MQFGVIIRNKWVYMYMLDVATDGKTEAQETGLYRLTGDWVVQETMLYKL